MTKLPGMSGLGLDVRLGARVLRRELGFAWTAVVILALGIGANTAVFSVVSALWLRPLPFRAPQQLCWLAAGAGAGGLSDTTFTVAGFEEYQRRSRSYQALTAYQPFFGDSDFTLTGQGEPETVSGVMVAGNFFQTLGVQPLLGRLFLPQEMQKGGPAAALLSYSYWRKQFGARKEILGRAITLDQQSVTVVGVLPPSFDFGSIFAPGQNMDVFVPAVMDRLRTWGHTLALLGRLRPGMTVAQAQAEANVLAPQVKAARPQAYFSDSMTVSSLKSHVSGKLRRSLLVLWLAVGLMLMIVCVNLANLMLARATSRRKEYALRLALGAGRGRLARQLLVESVIVCGPGAILGVGLAEGLVAYLAQQGSLALPLLRAARLDHGALAWAVLVTGLAALVIGLAPGFSVGRGDQLQNALKSSGPGVGESHRHGRQRAVLATAEIALACVLMAGAGLLLRSFLRVLEVDVGFQPSRAATMRVTYSARNSVQRGAILQAMLERVQAVAGIEAAGIGDLLPLARNRSWGLWRPGRTNTNEEKECCAYVQVVTPGYLRAMGIRLLEGRDLSWRDTASSPLVVIINQAAARREWPGESPIGRIAIVAGGHAATVIGESVDVRENSVETASGPEMYVSAAQFGPEGGELVIRSSRSFKSLSAEVTKTLRTLNPSQPAEPLQPLGQLVDLVTAPRRFLVWLMSSFAVLGMALAALGIYAVISYNVTQRAQEIGTRMALGASPGQVQGMVLRATLRLALIGAAIGGALSFAAARLLSPLLYGVTAADPGSYIAALATLIATAALAGYLPARRAAHIEPMEALRTS